MTCKSGDFGKYDKRVLKLLKAGTSVVLDKKTGKAYSAKSGKAVGSVKPGHGTDYVKISLPIGKLNPRTGSRKYEWYPLHRAMSLLYLGWPPDGCDRVNHKDGNGLNNKLKNLEWCSAKQNTAHAIAMGTFAQNGEDNQCSLLSEVQARAIMVSWKTDVELAEMYSVGPKTIQTVRYGMRWKHVFAEVSKTPEFRKAKRIRERNHQLYRSNITRKQLKQILRCRDSVRDTSHRYGISQATIRRVRTATNFAWARKRYCTEHTEYAGTRHSSDKVIAIFEARGTNIEVARRFNVTTSSVSQIKTRTTHKELTKGLKRG